MSKTKQKKKRAKGNGENAYHFELNLTDVLKVNVYLRKLKTSLISLFQNLNLAENKHYYFTVFFKENKKL